MKKKFKGIIVIILSIVFIIICFKSAVIRDVFYLVFVSFIISYTLKPIHKKLVEKGINKRISATLLIIACILFVMAAVGLLVPSIIRESLNIKIAVNEMQDFIDNIYEKIKPIKNNKTMYVILDTVYGKVDNAVIHLFSRVFDAALNLGEDALSLAVLPIISYYFLADSDKLHNKFLVLFPTKIRVMVKKILLDIDKVLGRYIVSQFMLCLIIGVLTFIILFFLKVDFPVILSLLNAIFNIIPYFGPLFGAIPAVIMALLQSPKTAIYTALWLYGIQQIEGNIISPKVTGDSVSMHPLVVILLLIIGGKLGGFVGMVIAVPIGVVIKVIYEDLNYYIF